MSEARERETARRPRSRVARGPDRPVYTGDADLDRLSIALVALLSEVSALRDRVDTHERLAEAGIVATPAAVEAFRAGDSLLRQRRGWRRALIQRVLRVFYEEPAPGGGGPPIAAAD